jgi:hypothetical protein
MSVLSLPCRQYNVHSEQYTLHLGSIRCNDEIHVAVYIAKLFNEMKVLWGYATGQGKTLPFFAVDSLSAQPTFALPDPQLPLPPMAQANNQPNGGRRGCSQSRQRIIRTNRWHADRLGLRWSQRGLAAMGSQKSFCDLGRRSNSTSTNTISGQSAR